MEDAFYIEVYRNIQVKIELVFKIHNLHLYPSSLPLLSSLPLSPLTSTLTEVIKALYGRWLHQVIVSSVVAVMVPLKCGILPTSGEAASKLCRDTRKL